MATSIPVYTSIAEIIAAVETNWPDNTGRLIQPVNLRAVVLGIVKYITDYMLYKPDVVPFDNESVVTITLDQNRIQELGYVPAPYVFFGDDTGGWQYTSVPWSIDKAPNATTTITVQVGGPSTGIIILK
jgi:hypothetical protein